MRFIMISNTFLRPFFKVLFSQKIAVVEDCEALCLQANLLAGGLPAGALALAASIASHTLTKIQHTQKKHTQKKTHAKPKLP